LGHIARRSTDEEGLSLSGLQAEDKLAIERIVWPYMTNERRLRMPNQDDFLKEVSALNDKPLKDLKEKYQKLYGPKKVVPVNRTFLVKRIVYKLQEQKHGGLSQAAKDKADALIKKHDPVNNKSAKSKNGDSKKANRDPRLPIPGTVIAKTYKGKKFEVKVLEKGFEFKGKPYRSLSAIAKDITGNIWNGFLFFGLTKKD